MGKDNNETKSDYLLLHKPTWIQASLYLSAEERCTLIDAMIQFSEDGTIMKFENPNLKKTFDLILPGLEKRLKNYEETCNNKKRSARVRELRKTGWYNEDLIYDIAEDDNLYKEAVKRNISNRFTNLHNCESISNESTNSYNCEGYEKNRLDKRRVGQIREDKNKMDMDRSVIEGDNMKRNDSSSSSLETPAIVGDDDEDPYKETKIKYRDLIESVYNLLPYFGISQTDDAKCQIVRWFHKGYDNNQIMEALGAAQRNNTIYKLSYANQCLLTTKPLNAIDLNKYQDEMYEKEE